MASGMQTVIYPVKDLQSANTTMNRVAYWVCTGLVVFFIGSGGLAYAMQVPDVVQGAVALGFPVHFIVLLGVWKVLGSIATGGDWWHVAAPLSIGVLVAASWAFRPESRRLPSATSAMLWMRPSQG